jgi:hypothetical protein
MTKIKITLVALTLSAPLWLTAVAEATYGTGRPI